MSKNQDLKICLTHDDLTLHHGDSRIDFKVQNINNQSFRRHGIEEDAIILAIERQKVHTIADVENLIRHYEDSEYVTLQILNTNDKVEYISLKF
jgi:PDZ domain-containing secreted protein